MANENYTKAWLYNGHVLTVGLKTNTGTITLEDGSTENTHTVIGAVDLLNVLNLTAGSTGDTLTDALLTDVAVSYIILDPAGTPVTLYSGVDVDGLALFTKDVPSADLTITDGVNSFTTSEDVDVYYLPDGDGTIIGGLLQKQVTDSMLQMIASLEQEARDIINNDIYNKMLALGLRYDR